MREKRKKKKTKQKKKSFYKILFSLTVVLKKKIWDWDGGIKTAAQGMKAVFTPDDTKKIIFTLKCLLLSSGCKAIATAAQKYDHSLLLMFCTVRIANANFLSK